MPADPPFLILVVDDEPPIHDLLSRSATSQFPQARFANTRSAQETMAYLDQLLPEVPDLVLLDIDLHQAVDGLTLLPMLHQRFNEWVPILMFTTASDIELVEQAHQKGAVAYMQKPEDLEEWRVCIDQLRDDWYRPAE